MGWLNKLGENIKYAHTVNNLGPAYAITDQAKEDLREQGKDAEAEKIEKAEAIGTVGGAIAGLTIGNGLPALSRGIQTFNTLYPIPARALNTMFAADGVRHLLSGNGVTKTIGHLNNGEWGKAIGSGVIDLLDLLGGANLAGDAFSLYRKASQAKKVVPALEDIFIGPYSNVSPGLQKIIRSQRVSDAEETLRTGVKHCSFLDEVDAPILFQDSPEMVYKYFEDNIIPRMVKNREWIDADKVANDVALNIKGKWSVASRKLFDLIGKSKNVKGRYHPDTNHIVIADDADDVIGTLLHEIRHKVDNGVPLTQFEDDVLRKAFGEEFKRIPYALANQYDTTDDMVTTVLDARRKIFGMKNVPIEEQNAIIDNMSTLDLIKAYYNSNGYGNELMQLLSKEDALTPERVQGLRDALKYVGIAALTPVLAGTEAEEVPQQKNGGKVNYLNLMNNGYRK